MNSRFPRSTVVLAGLVATALTLTSCGGGERTPQGSDGDTVRVVTSTNVWGSVVQAVGGDAVDVQAIITGTSADPHSYESTPRDAVTVAQAQLVVVNGGGYDEFVERILAGGSGEPPVVRAVSLAAGAEHRAEQHDTGHEEHTHEEPDAKETTDAAPSTRAHTDEHGHTHQHGDNEHVWYDLPTVEAVAHRVAEELGRLRPDRKDEFTRNAERFATQVHQLHERLTELHRTTPDAPVLATEPVAQLLLEDAGLRDVTPETFRQAVEEENDPPAAAVAEVEQLISGGQVQVVVHNPQTESPVTARVRDRAAAAGIPVVEMTETLPEGKDYLSWMTEQVNALTTALGRS